jgi:hypothetical protein
MEGKPLLNLGISLLIVEVFTQINYHLVSPISQWIVIFDLEMAAKILDSVPGGFHLADKYLLFTYIHNRGPVQ